MYIYHLSLQLLNNIAKMTMCQAYKHASNLSKVSTTSFAKMIPKTLSLVHGSKYSCHLKKTS